MMRRFVPHFALAALALAAAPASAQSLRDTHVEASGAAAGRSPHTAMREVSRRPNCGRTMHLPAGKLPTYGDPALTDDCRRAAELARNETAEDRGIRD